MLNRPSKCNAIYTKSNLFNTLLYYSAFFTGQWQNLPTLADTQFLCIHRDTQETDTIIVAGKNSWRIDTEVWRANVKVTTNSENSPVKQEKKMSIGNWKYLKSIRNFRNFGQKSGLDRNTLTVYLKNRLKVFQAGEIRF